MSNSFKLHCLLSPIWQGQNQAVALNLKANTEQLSSLKGNVKKSLILLSEAAQASSGDALATSITTTTITTNNNSSNDEPIHYNNLGVVYETHGKPHLALHAWSKALRSLSSSSSGNTTTTTTSTMSSVQSDGTARPDPSLPIMYNAATGALQARNYASAYECYATVLRHSPWRDRPRVWLRLAEACIGLQTQRTRGSKGRFSKVQVDGYVFLFLFVS
jgi:tetratricopeptide (TPR) repeat protein